MKIGTDGWAGKQCSAFSRWKKPTIFPLFRGPPQSASDVNAPLILHRVKQRIAKQPSLLEPTLYLPRSNRSFLLPFDLVIALSLRCSHRFISERRKVTRITSPELFFFVLYRDKLVSQIIVLFSILSSSPSVQWLFFLEWETNCSREKEFKGSKAKYSKVIVFHNFWTFI